MMVSGKGLADDLLGLPLEAEHHRRKQAEILRRTEEHRKRAVEDELGQQDRRVQSIRTAALQTLGGDAANWLTSANEDLNSLNPVVCAEQSQVGFANASAALDRFAADRQARAVRQAEATKEIAEEKRRQFDLEKNVLRLKAEARSRAKDPVRAELWCKTTNSKTGNKRPVEFCVDGPSLTHCIEVMPKRI